MTFYQNLINAGLPVETATENGEVVFHSPMTPEQETLYSDLVMQYFQPATYQNQLIIKADRQTLKDEYSNMVTRLEQIRDYSQATISQANLIAALKDMAKYQLYIIKIMRNLI